MEQLNIQSLEWLVRTALEKKEECEAVIGALKTVYNMSLEELEKSPAFRDKQSQLLTAEVCVAALNVRILQLKNKAA